MLAGAATATDAQNTPAGTVQLALNPLSGSALAGSRRALEAADDERWSTAIATAEQAGNRLLANVLRWQFYGKPRSGSSFEEITYFLEGHPDWPGQRLLKRRAEEAITTLTPVRMIDQWFSQNPPISVEGIKVWGKRLLEMGERAKAQAMVSKFWREESFGLSHHDTLLRQFGELLSPADHEARMERLLWERQPKSSTRMLSLVSRETALVAKARIKLMSKGRGVDDAIRAIPASLQDDPGLLFERVRWRRRADLFDGAVEILKNPPSRLGDPSVWWDERSILGRQALRRGEVSLSYRVVSDHRLTKGVDFAEAEFLSGWIATRFLREPVDGYRHFTSLFRGVGTPISLARGAYWAGRAADAAGDRKLAQSWYETAGQFYTTYYGQLAALKSGNERAAAFPPNPVPTLRDRENFTSKQAVSVIRMLAELDDTDRARPFFFKLARDFQTHGELVLLAELAREISRPDMALRIAKLIAREGIVLVQYGYPVIALPRLPAGLEPALVLALIRQESEFRYKAISHAGARGLMQLMPGTAKLVARQKGLGYDRAKLTDDPSYNMQLGSQYLADMLDRFDGSYVMALAAYNAGPGRVSQWVKQYGDPRHSDVDPVDWVEIIPFSETRNYVQRILETVQVYRHLLKGEDLRIQLVQDLTR